jgi:RHS repeat-associated protein
VRNSGASTFQHGDRLGTFSLQTNASQTATATRRYDAFGNLLSSTGTAVGAFGFAGKFGYQEDSDSSLKLLGHRYYDPSTGKFLARDPAKDGRSWYAYCASNPLKAVDPCGLIVLSVGLGGVAQFIVPAGWAGGDLLFDTNGNICWDRYYGGGAGLGLVAATGLQFGFAGGVIEPGTSHVWTLQACTADPFGGGLAINVPPRSGGGVSNSGGSGGAGRVTIGGGTGSVAGPTMVTTGTWDNGFAWLLEHCMIIANSL